MEQNYDFNSVGKKMPYTVPDGFFDQLEEQVMNEVKAEPAQKKSAKTIRIAIRTLLAVAACIALFLVVKKALPQGDDTITDDFTSVELAFNNLSTEDQDYLLEVYQEEEELIYDNDLNEWKNEESI
jgi:flagellar basal body-associated protein FliL